MDALRESLKSAGGQKQAATPKKSKGKPAAKRKAG
jgi:hypothetical protein